jgi:hypothetical protein
MKQFLMVPLIVLVSAVAAGQTAPDLRGVPEPAAPAQRRAELRQALKAAPGSEARTREAAPPAAPANRQLSAQERAELRQLLRQQGPQDKPERR